MSSLYVLRNRSVQKSRPSAQCLACATDYLTSGQRAESSIEASVFRSPPFHFVWHGQRGLHVAAIVGLHVRNLAALHPVTRHPSYPVQSAALVVHFHVRFAFFNLNADRGRELCVVT